MFLNVILLYILNYLVLSFRTIGSWLL